MATGPTVESAVVAALAYSDVFDWPLTADEIHASLGVRASRDEVVAALASPVLGETVGLVGNLYVLGGRTSIVDDRRRREAISARPWSRARRAGWIIGRLPFVRLVAVSGSLAVNAAEEDADIDLFVVTADGRLWTARAMVLGVARLMGRQRAELCPNYLVTESNLALAERDVFTAHELGYLAPLRGDLRPLFAANPWFGDVLPNHTRAADSSSTVDAARIGTESAGKRRRSGWVSAQVGRGLDRVERWERERKVARLRATAPPGSAPEARYDERTCKGHVDGHRDRILAAYEERRTKWAVQP